MGRLRRLGGMGLPRESLIGTLWEKQNELVCCSCAIGARRGSSYDSLRRPVARLMRVSFTDMREMCCCGPGARAPLLIVLSFVAIMPTGAFISTTDHAHVASRALAGLRRFDPSANVLFASDHDELEDGDQVVNIHRFIREVHRQVSSKNSSPLGSVFDGLSSSPFGSALDGYDCGSGPFGLARIGLGSLPLSSMFGCLGSSPFGTAFDGHDSLQLGSALRVDEREADRGAPATAIRCRAI